MLDDFGSSQFYGSFLPFICLMWRLVVSSIKDPRLAALTKMEAL